MNNKQGQATIGAEQRAHFKEDRDRNIYVLGRFRTVHQYDTSEAMT